MTSKNLSPLNILSICLAISVNLLWCVCGVVLLADDNGSGNNRPADGLASQRRSRGRLPDGGSDFFGDHSEGISCPRRNKCQGDWRSLPFYARNCFCDDLCATYDDCCSDWTPKEPEVRLLSKPNTQCRRIEDIDTNYEIYIVDSCPDGFRNTEIRKLCETELWSSVFYRIPVISSTTKILYRNLYCAICSRDSDVMFWNVVQSCKLPPIDDFPLIETTADFQRLFVAMQKCSMDYVYPPGLSPRKCKSNTARCDRTWRGKQVARNCRNHTEYVYSGLLVFKNKYCAQCNFLDESHFSCEDQRTPKTEFVRGQDNDAAVGSKFTASIEISSRNSSLTMTFTEYSNGSNITHFEQHQVDLGHCSDEQIFDPFVGICRQVHCQNGTIPRVSACSEEVFDEVVDTRKNKTDKKEKIRKKQKNRNRQKLDDSANDDDDSDDDNSDNNDDNGNNINKIKNNSNTSGSNKDHPLNDVILLQDDKDHISNRIGRLEQTNGPISSKVISCPMRRLEDNEFIIFENLSLLATSTGKLYDPNSYLREHNHILVCQNSVINENNKKFLVDSSLHYKKMFTFDHLQHLLSLVSVVVTSSFTVICLVVYLLYSTLRNVSGQIVICFCVAVLLCQGLYITVSVFEKQNFANLSCICVGIAFHYAILSVFFWLNALGIESCLMSSTVPSLRYVRSFSCGRFIAYFLYCTVAPMLVVGGSLTMDILRTPAFCRPMYGVLTCWIANEKALLFLLALPLALIFLINLYLFFVSAAFIYSFSASEQSYLKNNRQFVETYHSHYIVCVLLVFLESLKWTAALTATFTQLTVLYFIFVGCNLLFGLTIFVGFLCNRRTYSLLQRHRVRDRTDNETPPIGFYGGRARNTPKFACDREQRLAIGSPIYYGEIVSHETSI